MTVKVVQPFRNLPVGLEIPVAPLCIFTGPNNSGKSSLLMYLNQFGDQAQDSDYISPRRFDLSNQIAVALNSDDELRSLWNQRKQYNDQVSELTAPDPIRELLGLSNPSRKLVTEWHARYFGDLSVARSNEANDFSAPRITIDGRLASQQGSGSRAVLAVLVGLLHPDRKVILIDEPEISIEPQVQKRLARLIKDVTQGRVDGLPQKSIYIATHSHLFIDRADLSNNYVVTRDQDGKASIRQLQSQEELHTLIYRLLGNSPEDLLFPDNIVVVEGPSDGVFWEKILGLSKAGAISAHYADGDGKIAAALPALDQMLKTLAHTPWYRERICVVVDSGVSDATVKEWRDYLKDDGTRVRRLSRNGIEYYYPTTLLEAVTQVPPAESGAKIDEFIGALRGGARKATLGSFEGSKRELANRVVALMTADHLDEISGEILDAVQIAKDNSFSAEASRR